MSSSAKRKRQDSHPSAPPSSQPSKLPADSINPFSRSPAQLLQFSIAGLHEAEQDPSRKIPDFPHRGFDTGITKRATPGPAQQEGGEETAEKEPRRRTNRERQLNTLLQSIQLFLDKGDVAKAARLYGLVLQLQPNGHPIDIRQYSLWAIGAEILMRGGEKPLSTLGTETKSPRQSAGAKQTRWGSAANMAKVKAYFETLIQRYPYDYRRPQTVSSLDFQLAMLSCEIYNVHAEHIIALRSIDDGTSADDEEDMGEDSDSDGSPGNNQGTRTSNKRKDKCRAQALAEMVNIAARMDSIGQEQPFSKSQDFWRLRATASLYMADLAIPLQDTSPLAMQQGQFKRQRDHETAKNALEKVIKFGGELDHSIIEFFQMDEEDENAPLAMPTYSSLPIRKA